MTTTRTLDALDELVGTELVPSPWLLVDQDRIDTFARATDPEGMS